jgi:hypothetical protein
LAADVGAFLAVTDKPFDHVHGRLSCPVALDARAKRLLLNMILAITGEPALQRGAGSFFFPNMANLLYNGQAISEPGGQR